MKSLVGTAVIFLLSLSRVTPAFLRIAATSLSLRLTFSPLALFVLKKPNPKSLIALVTLATVSLALIEIVVGTTLAVLSVVLAASIT